MKTVKCKSGNEYELALGIGILKKIEQTYEASMPASAMKRAAMEAQRLDLKGEEAAKWAQDNLLEMMTPEEDKEMVQAQLDASMVAVKKSLRKLNGVSIPNMDDFFDEDLSAEDYEELAVVVEDAYSNFKGVVEGDEESMEGHSPSSELGLAAEA